MQISSIVYFKTGKDAKRAILLAEENQSDIESAFYKEAVAKKYASFFQSTLHHNNGYFIQVTLFHEHYSVKLGYNEQLGSGHFFSL
jgi:hypothetical protein